MPIQKGTYQLLSEVQSLLMEADEARAKAAIHPLEDALPERWHFCPHCEAEINPIGRYDDAEPHAADCPLDAEEEACVEHSARANRLEAMVITHLRDFLGLSGSE